MRILANPLPKPVVRFFILLLFFIFCSGTNYAQQKTIIGVVRDKNTHQELSNVNIYIENTQIGASTDFTGKYSIKIPSTISKAIVVFQHIAYEKYETSLAALLNESTIYLQPRVVPLEGVQVEQEIDKPEIKKDLPQTVSVMKSQKFDIRGFVDAGDLLESDHSIQVDEELSGKKTISIRGGNPDEVVVLYNGIKMNSTYDNVFDLSLIDLEDIKRFEIIKGSNTTLYGPEAFSGVINIVPKAQYDYNIRFQQRFGTYKSGNWGLHLFQHLDRMNVSYSLKKGATSRQFIDSDNDQLGLENSSMHHTANFSYKLSNEENKNAANEISAMFIYSDLDYLNHRDNEKQADLNRLVSMKYTGDIYKLTNVDLSASMKKWDENLLLTTEKGGLNLDISDQTYHFDAEKHIQTGMWEFLFAYQYSHSELNYSNQQNFTNVRNIGIESSDFFRNHHGLVSITKLHTKSNSEFLRSVDIDISYRYDHILDEQKNPVLRSGASSSQFVGLFHRKNWQDNMLKFAINFSAYREDMTVDAYMSFGKNTKFPTLYQQISSPVLITSQATTPNLNPEKNRSTELSIVVAKEYHDMGNILGWQLSGNFFQNYYDNKFRISTNPGIPVPFYDNVADARIAGLETQASLFLLQKKITFEFGLSKYYISEKAAFPFKSDFKTTFDVILNHSGYSFQIHWFSENEQVGWLRESNTGDFYQALLPRFSNLDLHLSKTINISNLKLFLNATGRNLIHNDKTDLEGLAIRDRRFYLTVGAQY